MVPHTNSGFKIYCYIKRQGIEKCKILSFSCKNSTYKDVCVDNLWKKTQGTGNRDTSGKRLEEPWKVFGENRTYFHCYIWRITLRLRSFISGWWKSKGRLIYCLLLILYYLYNELKFTPKTKKIRNISNILKKGYIHNLVVGRATKVVISFAENYNPEYKYGCWH